MNLQNVKHELTRSQKINITDNYFSILIQGFFYCHIVCELFPLQPLQKSKDSRKGPVVILSITYRGVKFIDAATKVMGKYVVVSRCISICPTKTLQLALSSSISGWFPVSTHILPLSIRL